MMQYHIGTISTVTQKIDYLRYVPDFQNCNIDRIMSILQQNDNGYCAEVISYYGNNKIKIIAQFLSKAPF